MMPGDKLKSSSGATLLLALLFFLLCALAGSVVLAAGTAAGGRISKLKEKEQEYYKLNSAARFFRDEIEGRGISMYSFVPPQELQTDFVNSKIKEDEGGYNTEPAGHLSELLRSAAQQVFMGKCMEAPYSEELTVRLSGDTDSEVTVKFEMDSSYNIRILIPSADVEQGTSDGMSMTVEIPAAISLQPSDGTGLEKDGEGKVIRYTTTLIWVDAVITKG